MRTALSGVLLSTLLLGASYTDETLRWRAEYDAHLRAPDGWLSVSGLTWLHEGRNIVGAAGGSDVPLPKGLPDRAGVLLFERDSVQWEPAGGGARQTLKPDDPGPPDAVTVGRVRFTIIKRGEKTGVRLRDPESQMRREFTGAVWYPASEAWRVHAKWVAWPEPKQMMITNILGMTEPQPSPGYAEFAISGQTLRLSPIVEDNELFFLFRDKTSAHGTYGAGRFLYADMPKKGEVILDFNKAHNPPCAFTPYATCPLPPKQNALPVAITAGEKSYGHR